MKVRDDSRVLEKYVETLKFTDVSKPLEYIVNTKLSIQPEDTAKYSSTRPFQSHMHTHSTTTSQIQGGARK